MAHHRNYRGALVRRPVSDPRSELRDKGTPTRVIDYYLELLNKAQSFVSTPSVWPGPLHFQRPMKAQSFAGYEAWDIMLHFQWAMAARWPGGRDRGRPKEGIRDGWCPECGFAAFRITLFTVGRARVCGRGCGWIQPIKRGTRIKREDSGREKRAGASAPARPGNAKKVHAGTAREIMEPPSRHNGEDAQEVGQ